MKKTARILRIVKKKEADVRGAEPLDVDPILMEKIKDLQFKIDQSGHLNSTTPCPGDEVLTEVVSSMSHDAMKSVSFVTNGS